MNDQILNRTTLALTKNLFKRVICLGIGRHWLSCLFFIHCKGFGSQVVCSWLKWVFTDSLNQFINQTMRVTQPVIVRSTCHFCVITFNWNFQLG